MKKSIKITLIAVGLVMVLGLSAFTLANQVQAQGTPPTDRSKVSSPNERINGNIQALADELNISLEALQAAHIEAGTAFIQAEVASGELTQAQADEIIEDLDDAGRTVWRNRRGIEVMQSDAFETYLAEALGISIEDLQQARENVFMSEIAQAVTDGKLTQEQADLMIARKAIKSYLPDAMKAAQTSAINQALADGKITQAQADLLLSNLESHSFHGFMGGRQGRRP